MAVKTRFSAHLALIFGLGDHATEHAGTAKHARLHDNVKPFGLVTQYHDIVSKLKPRVSSSHNKQLLSSDVFFLLSKPQRSRCASVCVGLILIGCFYTFCAVCIDSSEWIEYDITKGSTVCYSAGIFCSVLFSPAWVFVLWHDVCFTAHSHVVPRVVKYFQLLWRPQRRVRLSKGGMKLPRLQRYRTSE